MAREVKQNACAYYAQLAICWRKHPAPVAIGLVLLSVALTIPATIYATRLGDRERAGRALIPLPAIETDDGTLAPMRNPASVGRVATAALFHVTTTDKERHAGGDVDKLAIRFEDKHFVPGTQCYCRAIGDKQIDPDGTTNITAAVFTSDKTRDGWLYIGELTIWFDDDPGIKPVTRANFQVIVHYDPSVRNPTIR